MVTGGAGYIGSVLVAELLKAGHKVKCLDRFFFGRESLANVISDPNLEIIKDDIRWFDAKILKNVDTVMDLAALSNEPTAELDPSKTFDINYLGRRDSLSSEQQKYWSKGMATFAGMVDNMDYNIGKVINYLRQIGQYNNTFIIFTSDNGGSSPSNRPLAEVFVFYKILLYSYFIFYETNYTK